MRYNVNYSTKNQSSDVDIFVNDKPPAQTYTRKQDSLFIISRDNKRPQIYKEPINYTTIQLFFEEPIGLTSCYSEEDGSINKLVATKINKAKEFFLAEDYHQCYIQKKNLV